MLTEPPLIWYTWKVHKAGRMSKNAAYLFPYLLPISMQGCRPYSGWPTIMIIPNIYVHCSCQYCHRAVLIKFIEKIRLNIYKQNWKYFKCCLCHLSQAQLSGMCAFNRICSVHNFLLHLKYPGAKIGLVHGLFMRLCLVFNSWEIYNCLVC